MIAKAFFFFKHCIKKQVEKKYPKVCPFLKRARKDLLIYKFIQVAFIILVNSSSSSINSKMAGFF